MAIDAHRTPRLSILLFLLLLSVGTAAQVSRDTLSNGDTVYISNCRYNRGSIVVDTAWLSQMAANPSLGFDAWAVLNLNEVRTIVTYGVSMPAAAGNANSFYIYNDSFSISPGAAIIPHRSLSRYNGPRCRFLPPAATGSATLRLPT